VTLERTVKLVNVSPQITAIPVWKVTEHKEAILNVSSFISDGNDPLSKVVIQGIDPNVTIQGLVLRAMFNDWAPPRIMQITVSDGEDTTYANISIEVTNVNDPPSVPVILSPVNGTSFKVGEAIVFNVSLYDPDLKVGDILQITWLSDKDGQIWQYQSNKAAPFIVNNLRPGRHTITVKVSDGQYEKTSSVEVTVKANNLESKTNYMGIIIIIIIIIIVALLIILYKRKKQPL
jgi:hypothetical protein